MVARRMEVEESLFLFADAGCSISYSPCDKRGMGDYYCFVSGEIEGEDFSLRYKGDYIRERIERLGNENMEKNRNVISTLEEMDGIGEDVVRNYYGI